MNNKEYLGERISKMDTECEELQHQITHIEKKIIKLQAEKKKFAELKKFKDASKA